MNPTFQSLPPQIQAFWNTVNRFLTARGEKPYTVEQMTGMHDGVDVRDSRQVALLGVAASFARQEASRRTGITVPDSRTAGTPSTFVAVEARAVPDRPHASEKRFLGVNFLCIKASAGADDYIRRLIRSKSLDDRLKAFEEIRARDPFEGETMALLNEWLDVMSEAMKRTRRAA